MGGGTKESCKEVSLSEREKKKKKSWRTMIAPGTEGTWHKFFFCQTSLSTERVIVSNSKKFFCQLEKDNMDWQGIHSH